MRLALPPLKLIRDKYLKEHESIKVTNIVSTQ